MIFTVIGTPGDRRTELFTAASRPHRARIVSWTDVLTGAPLDLEPGTLLRIDSPGEDAEVDALLRGPGDPARIGGGARWYASLTAALGRIGAAATAAGAIPLSDPGEIAVMFDKRRCHARLLAAGVPVPPALGPVHDYAELRARMAATGGYRVFVKPAHGSSASGVIALQTAGGCRIKATTSAVPDSPGTPYPRRFRNSLRVRSYETEREVAALVDTLAPDGLHVERWLPKVSLHGRVLDLRVVVVAGRPTHVVVRTSRHPMTNLHLGGGRGDLDEVWAALGEPGRRAALDVCVRAAACFPDTLMVGVDLLIGLGWRRFAVAEVNAFGDLLPGATGLPGSGADGLDTYAAQVRAALTRSVAA